MADNQYISLNGESRHLQHFVANQPLGINDSGILHQPFPSLRNLGAELPPLVSNCELGQFEDVGKSSKLPGSSRKASIDKLKELIFLYQTLEPPAVYNYHFSKLATFIRDYKKKELQENERLLHQNKLYQNHSQVLSEIPQELDNRKHGYSNASVVSVHNSSIVPKEQNKCDGSCRLNSTLTSKNKSFVLFPTFSSSEGGNGAKITSQASVLHQQSIHNKSKTTFSKNDSLYDSVRVVSVSHCPQNEDTEFSDDESDHPLQHPKASKPDKEKSVKSEKNYILENWSIKKNGGDVFLTGTLIDPSTKKKMNQFVSSKIVSRPAADTVRTIEGLYLLRGKFLPAESMPEVLKGAFQKQFPSKWRSICNQWKEKIKTKRTPLKEPKKPTENVKAAKISSKSKDKESKKEPDIAVKDQIKRKKSIAPLKSRKDVKKHTLDENNEQPQKGKVVKSVSESGNEGWFGDFDQSSNSSAIIKSPNAALNSAVKMVENMAGRVTPPTPMLKCYISSKGNTPKSIEESEFSADNKKNNNHVAKRIARNKNQKKLHSILEESFAEKEASKKIKQVLAAANNRRARTPTIVKEVFRQKEPGSDSENSEKLDGSGSESD